MPTCPDTLLREPTPRDGVAASRLIARCPPLDTNSVYCNLLQCSHFARTSAAAERAGTLVGFVSGYLSPEHPDTLFIWQVAVDQGARGEGLASRMLTEILRRPNCAEVRWLETTITPANRASWKLFEGYAAKQRAQVSTKKLFDRQLHFQGEHATEYLLRIGPLFRPLPENKLNHTQVVPAGALRQEAIP